MIDEPALPRSGRGALLDSLSKEDLDLYSVEELDERTARLHTELERIDAFRRRKLAGRAAADALFSSVRSED